MPMSFHLALEASVALLPVLLFLGGLIYLDSFRLVALTTAFAVLSLGAFAAGASYFVSGAAMDALHLDFAGYSRYAAPLVEESLKAAAVVLLFSRNRVGFMIDAIILGVAVGAGFSMFENIYYAWLFPDADIGVWIVRGFGTALMHGGTAAVFAVTAQILRERCHETGVAAYLPGFVMAVSLHSLFNQFTPWPLYSAAGTMVVLPLMLLFLFDKSEHEVHTWLIHDYETHERLLEAIRDGSFVHSEAARFISRLVEKFPRNVVTTIFAYVKLHTTLVLRAEQMTLAQETGRHVRATEADREDFARLHRLERSIGRTALLTIWPYLKFSRQEMFEIQSLERRAQHTP